MHRLPLTVKYLRAAGVLFAVLALSIRSIHGAEGTGAPPSDQPLPLRTWKVPPGFIPKPERDPASRNREVRAYLESNGLTFPSGAFASYFPHANMLIVRNTPENLDLMEMMVGTCRLGFSPNAVIDVVALDCALSLPGGNTAWLTPQDIGRLAPGDVRVLSQVSAIAKSGFKITSRRTTTSSESKPRSSNGDAEEEPDDAEGFRPDETGAIFTVEPIIGPDGHTVDLDYRYRLKRGDKNTIEIDLDGIVCVHDGSPAVIHISPLETEGQTLVLIAGVRLVGFEGKRLPNFWETLPSE